MSLKSEGIPALDETMEGSLYSFIKAFFGFSSQRVLVSAFLSDYQNFPC